MNDNPSQPEEKPYTLEFAPGVWDDLNVEQQRAMMDLIESFGGTEGFAQALASGQLEGMKEIVVFGPRDAVCRYCKGPLTKDDPPYDDEYRCKLQPSPQCKRFGYVERGSALHQHLSAQTEAIKREHPDKDGDEGEPG